MQPGELLCVITDGVSEAQDPAGALFGGARVEAMLARMGGGAASAQSIVDALQAEVGAFANGAEPADDLTILALRWQGPGAGAPTS
jgi:serine phosphatase RsbU (regulator of sigma subunit)